MFIGDGDGAPLPFRPGNVCPRRYTLGVDEPWVFAEGATPTDQL
ncbi:hypothetical protein GCM10009809_27380 [Isoptericola hypogeus]|uniref:Uncharacterized protein n=1 Tax=Isoptericola hypogeus TaxID=300179 RepID=A0ABN2JKG3_9MICO